MGDVVNIADWNDDCRSINVEQVLTDGKDFAKENPQYNKVIVIFLDTSDDKFKIRFSKAQMYNSEGVAVCEITKTHLVDSLI